MAHNPVRKAVRGTLVGLLAFVVAVNTFFGEEAPAPAAAVSNAVPSSSPTPTAAVASAAPTAPSFSPTPTVSPASFALPDVTGADEDDATTTLIAASLVLSWMDLDDLPSCSLDCVVVSTSPESGTELVQGTTVLLVRAEREAYDFYRKHSKMPKLIGLTANKASAVLDTVSPLVETDYVTAKAGQKADQVVKQSPRAGTVLRPGQPIRLTVTEQDYFATEDTPTESEELDDVPADESRDVVPGVHPGAFCSPRGALGRSKSGVLMRCSTKAGDSRARWRSS
ncbi:PASTA domain-containing protein [Planomonospora algeriensis]